MGKIIAEITMSLDGFIAGPDISSKEPMGRNGEQLHNWMFEGATEEDRQMANEIMNSCGAVILGNRTYTLGLDPWGGVTPFKAPAFVICHNIPATKVEGFVYANTGIHEALGQAKLTAAERPVWVMGGASVIQQYLKAGLIEELRIHIAPVLLMQGTRLFENTGVQPMQLTSEKISSTPAAIHTMFSVHR